MMNTPDTTALKPVTKVNLFQYLPHLLGDSPAPLYTPKQALLPF